MVHILAFRSNPATEELLRLDEEVRRISDSISPLARRDFKLENVGAVRIRDLPHHLLKSSPDIFHFSGHGSKKGELIFEDEYGTGRPVNSETIRLIFQLLGKSITCVVLSSCYSDHQAKEIAKYVPYVLGNTKEIEDELAIEFSSTFYSCLSYGKTIEESFLVARAVISSSNSNNSKIPFLHKKTASESNIALFRQPTVNARFALNNRGNPSREGYVYDMIFWVENLPHSVLSIVYNFNHETIVDGISEVKNDGSGIETEGSFFGNFQLRVTLWFQTEGIGIVITVYDALRNYYKGKKLNPSIKKALQSIKEN